MQFPHCDARILHSPGECEYCDRHPDWQELRKTWHIGFTGRPHANDWFPCPADYARPPHSESDHRRWAGNVATTAQPVNETAASKMMYGWEEVEAQLPTAPSGGIVRWWLRRRRA